MKLNIISGGILLCASFLTAGLPYTLNDGVANDNFLNENEKGVVSELNQARMNPAEYAKKLIQYRTYYNGRLIKIPGKIDQLTFEGTASIDEAIQFLKNQKAIAPLKLSYGMSLGAKDHVRDQGPKGSVGHNGADGSDPFRRINRYGTYNGYSGENIDYSSNDAQTIVMRLIIDDGVSSRGHRKNIFNDKFAVTGVSIGVHKKYNFMCVMTFASEYAEKKKMK